MPDSGEDELDRIFHKMRTRALRDAPIYLEHIVEAEDDVKALIAQQTRQARLQAASDIFSLAHEYAQADTTMHGAEELRNYHYFNAIHKIGEFDGR